MTRKCVLRRRLWRSMSILLALGIASVAGSSSAKAPDPALVAAPRALVAQTLHRVLVILDDRTLESAERRERIEAIAFDVFDFRTMSKLSLGRNWKHFDEEQREQFVEEFKRHLSRNYGSRLDRYQQTDVRIVGARLEPRNDVTVLSKVVGGQFDGIEMNYRMRRSKHDGRWRAIDVVIEGVSLVANFRSQFAEVLSGGGPAELLRQLRTKNFDFEHESTRDSRGSKG